MCVLSPDKTPLYINPPFKELFNTSSLTELEAAGGLENILKDNVVFSQVMASIKKGVKWEGNVKMLSREDTGFIGRLKSNTIFNKQKEVIGGVLIFKKLLFETADTLSSNFLEAFVQNANDAVMVTEAVPYDEPGPKIIYVNPAFTNMSGFSQKR